MTVGSRGITAIDSITKLVVSFLREAGALPFIFPAMGSHGGGTAAGQRERDAPGFASAGGTDDISSS